MSRFLCLRSSLHTDVFPLVWPANLVYCALFNTLHQQQYEGIGNRGGISREKFFLYAFLGSASWYFFPDYIFQGKVPAEIGTNDCADLIHTALGYFNWVCWIVPNNIVVNQLFGYSSGLVSLPLIGSMEMYLQFWSGNESYHL